MSSNALILGKSGYGKTYYAKKMIRHILDNNKKAKVVVIDSYGGYTDLLNDYKGQKLVLDGKNFIENFMQPCELIIYTVPRELPDNETYRTAVLNYLKNLFYINDGTTTSFQHDIYVFVENIEKLIVGYYSSDMGMAIPDEIGALWRLGGKYNISLIGIGQSLQNVACDKIINNTESFILFGAYPQDIGLYKKWFDSKHHEAISKLDSIGVRSGYLIISDDEESKGEWF